MISFPVAAVHAEAYCSPPLSLMKRNIPPGAQAADVGVESGLQLQDSRYICILLAGSQ